MKIKKVNELLSSKYDKHLNFIYDKFNLRKNCKTIRITKIQDSGVELSILFDGDEDLDTKILKPLLDYFEECDGFLSVSDISNFLNFIKSKGDFVYHLKLSNNFLEKIEIEIDEKKYNL